MVEKRDVIFRRQTECEFWVALVFTSVKEKSRCRGYRLKRNPTGVVLGADLLCNTTVRNEWY